MKFTAEHLGIASLDPAALKDWYINVLQAELIFQNNQTPPAYLLSLGGLTIEIYRAETSLPATSNNLLAGWRHVALRVDSIEQTRAVLEKNGVQFPDPVKPALGGGHVLFFRDPEQNLLHLVERPQDSTLRR